MGVVRVKQNVLAESSVGLIATSGDPRGRTGSWLVGGDATYQTSRMKGDKNFLLGVWGIAMGRDGLGPDSNAYGVSLDYPNDLWDTVVKYWRVGQDFDPSLGFVARRGVHAYTFNTEYKPRPDFWNIRQMFFEFRNSLVTDLDGQWESYRDLDGAGELAVRERRPGGSQLDAHRRAPGGALRGVAGRGHPARFVSLDALSPRGPVRRRSAGSAPS